MDSWPAYSKRLEQFFVVNDIADGKKVAVLLTVYSIGTKIHIIEKHHGARVMLGDIKNYQIRYIV